MNAQAQNIAVYRLKPMVIARVGAELTVALILVALPVVLAATGQLLVMHWSSQAVAIGLAVVASPVIWAALHLTHTVKVADSGVSLLSLAGKSTLDWSQIRSLRLVTSWGWRRYVLDTERGNLSFPAWMNRQAELLEKLRSRLPNRGIGKVETTRRFHLHPVTGALETAKNLAFVAFAGLFWWFLASLGKGNQSEDKLVVLAACIVISLIAIARLFFACRTSTAVETGDEGVKLTTFLGTKQAQWKELSLISNIPPFFPDGTYIKLNGRPYLLSGSLESFDELEDIVKNRACTPVDKSKRR